MDKDMSQLKNKLEAANYRRLVWSPTCDLCDHSTEVPDYKVYCGLFDFTVSLPTAQESTCDKAVVTGE
jgi:hypothetical protein